MEGSRDWGSWVMLCCGGVRVGMSGAGGGVVWSKSWSVGAHMGDRLGRGIQRARCGEVGGACWVVVVGGVGEADGYSGVGGGCVVGRW